MKRCLFWILGCSLASGTAWPKAVVTPEVNDMDASFAFEAVGLPANNDAAAHACFAVVDGEPDSHSAPLEVLHDGFVPSSADQPSSNFFFRAGGDGGRVRVDLGHTVPVREVRSYSWHVGNRGPQVYALYASDGTPPTFNAEPKRGTDLRACGWRFVAQVDTRSHTDDDGGQHGVSIASPSGTLGAFRYLLFDCLPTESLDAFGNTFYSEIDVIAADGPPLTSSIVSVPRIRERFTSADGRCRFTVDATDAPDLAEWASATLKPTLREWYGHLAALLPSEGYRPPERVALRFRTDMGGTPASAGGGCINLNADWFRRERGREALGCVIHELVHVVQNYGRAGRTNPKPSRTPGWVVEGLADYVRWFLFEPQTGGAAVTARNFEHARYDGSYRISANFLDWVTRTRGRDLVCKLNAAAREGRYSDALWKEWTGDTLEALGDAWRQENARRLGIK